MPHRRILTVEDDSAIRRGIVDSLRFAGFEVVEASRGDDGAQFALQQELDLVLLDVVLPGMSGLQVLKQIRAARPTLPVILLTARGAEDDRVEGLRLGADDYVVKPFSVKELLARVEAVMRRSPARPLDIEEAQLVHGVADFSRREIRYHDGGRCEFSEKESELLRYLVQNARRVITRDELLENVWRVSARGLPTRTIDMHVARLREKLRDDAENPAVLVTVRGKGYMLAMSE